MSSPFVFWLGTDRINWLEQHEIPMMISRRALHRRKTMPVARTKWVLDSGGFTELSMHGRWTISAGVYASQVRRIFDEVGNLQWAAGQDWMCEPWIIEKTGKTVEEHQRLTVDNFLELKTWAPDLPFIPTLQGWEMGDYVSHVQMYEDAGVRLVDQPIVGLGSVCRRQATSEIGAIVSRLHSFGLRLHGFGCKAGAIAKYGQLLASADSMAWSFNGRYAKFCPEGKRACAHCFHFAMEWRDKVLAASRHPQYTLDFA